MVHTSAGAPPGLRHIKNGNSSAKHSAAVRNGAKSEQLSEQAGQKAREAFAMLKDITPPPLTALTPDAAEELWRVKVQDDRVLLIKSGDVIGVFHRGRWVLVRARVVDKASGTCLVSDQVSSANAPTAEVAAALAAAEEQAIASDAAAEAAWEVPALEVKKKKRAEYMRQYRAKQNGTDASNVLTYKGETLVYVMRAEQGTEARASALP